MSDGDQINMTGAAWDGFAFNYNANKRDSNGNAIGQSTRFYNGNMVEIVRFTADGRVGIGTASPAYRLHVAGEASATKVYGAVWNDYAEYRKSTELEPGRCVIETGDGSLIRSFGRLEPGAEIVSDTFGFAIGETDECKTPLAVSGRVLAYPAEDRESYKPGDAVCSGPNGTVSKMTRQEIREWPDRIIGTVSEIPNYETWGTGNVPVNGRIWIRIR